MKHPFFEVMIWMTNQFKHPFSSWFFLRYQEDMRHPSFNILKPCHKSTSNVLVAGQWRHKKTHEMSTDPWFLPPVFEKVGWNCWIVSQLEWSRLPSTRKLHCPKLTVSNLPRLRASQKKETIVLQPSFFRGVCCWFQGGYWYFSVSAVLVASWVVCFLPQRWCLGEC